MNTHQLQEILATNSYASIYFKGIYAADQLPIHIKYPCSIVCNTDPSSKPGMHWIAIYIDKYGYGEYFDSYGLQPWVSQHIEFLNRNCIKWKYNGVCLQNLYSSLCGNYCAVFIYLKSRGFTMYDITTKLGSTNLTAGDSTLLKLYNDIFSTSHIRKTFTKKCQSCVSKNNWL
jgi:hypothetical protein